MTSLALVVSGIAAQAGQDALWQPQVRAIIGANNHGGNAAIEGFVPLKQSAESVLFLDVRSKDDFDNGFGQDFGIGIRRIVNPDLMVGGYAYVNLQTYDGHRFTGATLGAEAITPNYDAHVNVYLPFGNDQTTHQSSSSLSIVSNQLLEQVSSLDKRNYAAWGIEGEVGAQVPVELPENQSLRLSIGGYHFGDPDGSDASITGAKAGLEYSIGDVFGSGTQLTFAGEVRNDNRDNTQFVGSVRLTVPFNPPASSAHDADSEPVYPVSEGLRKRVNERVRGDIGVRVETQESSSSSSRVAINAKTNAAFGKFFFADGANTLGLGTIGDPTTLDDAVAKAGSAGFVVALGGKGNITTAGANLATNQTVIGGGESVDVLLSSGGTTTFNLGGSDGAIQGTNAANPVLTLANGDAVQGVAITGGGDGISGANVTKVTLTDVTVSGAGANGVSFSGDATSVTGSNLTSGSNGADGLHIEGDGTYSFTGTTTLSGNGDDGLDITGKGTYAFATIDASGNADRGITVQGTAAGGSFTTTGGTVSGNGGTAVFIDPITAHVVLDAVTQDGGEAGIVLDNVSGSFTVTGKTTVSNTSGAGIAISNSPAAIRFGDVEITNPGTAGVDFNGVNATVVAGDIVVSGLGLNTTGLDFSGAGVAFTAQSLNVTGTGAAGSIGIDLVDTVAGTSAVITDGGVIANVDTGVRLGIAGSRAHTANAEFSFGGGAIGGITASLDMRGLSPVSGHYAFSSTIFNGPQLFDPSGLIFVGSAATGTGNGSSVDDLASVATAKSIADASAIFVLVNDGTAINVGGGWSLHDGQTIASFGNGRTFSGGGAPANVTGDNVIATAAVVDDPTGLGAATLTNIGDPAPAGSTVHLADGNFIADVIISDQTGHSSIQGIGIDGFTGTGITLTGDLTGLQFSNVSGTVGLTNTTISGMSSAGISIDNSSARFSFANTTIDNSASAGRGVLLTSNTGAVSFSGGLRIQTASGTGFDASGGGTVTVAASAGDESITTSAGSALSLNGITAAIAFDAVNSTGSGGNGITLDTVAGTFTVNGGAISNPAGDGVSIVNSSVNASFAGLTITNAGGDGFHILDPQGGATTTINATVNGAVGSAINFDSDAAGSNGKIAVTGGTYVSEDSAFLSSPFSAGPGSSTLDVALTGGTFASTTGAFGIEIAACGCTNITISEFSGITVNMPGLSSSGIDVEDADFNVTHAGTVSIGTLTDRTAGAGLFLLGVTGTLDISVLNVFSDSGAPALTVLSAAPADFTLSIGSGTVNAINAGAIFFGGLTADVSLTGVINDASTSDGIDLEDVAGSFTVTGNTTITNAAGFGIFAQDNSATISFAGTTITGAGLDGIYLANNSAAVAFGDTTITNPGGAGFPGAGNGIDIEGTNAAINFGTVDVTGIGNGQTALDLSGSTSTFEATTLNVTGAGGTSTAIDLSGTVGGSVTIGGGAISGVGTGVQMGTNGAANLQADTTFSFGAAGASSIAGTTASLDMRGLTAGSGTYAFHDTVLTGPQLFDQANIVYVSATSIGTGDGSSLANLISAADADKLGAPAGTTFVLVGTVDNQTINTDADGFTLAAGQSLVSFADGNAVAIGGPPTNVTGTNVLPFQTLDDPLGKGGSTAPILDNASGSAIVLADGDVVSYLNVANATAGAAIDGSGGITGFTSAGVTVTSSVTGLDLTSAAGTLSIENLTVQGASQYGIVLQNSGATANFTGTTTTEGTLGGVLANNFHGDATFDDLDISGGGGGVAVASSPAGDSSGSLTFGAASSISGTGGIAFAIDGATPTVVYNGTITQIGAASAVAINGMTGGSATFSGLITANTGSANAIDLTSNTGATIGFTGGLDLTTDGGFAFNATGGGTISVTGTNNTVDAGAGAAGSGIRITGATIGSAGVAFQSVTADGAGTQTGIDVENTTGGPVTFGNTTIKNVNAAGTAILLNNVAGGPYSFTGTTTIDTTHEFVSGLVVDNSSADVSVANLVTTSIFADDLSLSNDSGTITVSGGTIANSGFDDGVVVSGGSADITVAADITSASASNTAAVRVDGITGGSVAFSGAVSASSGSDLFDIGNTSALTGGSVSLSGSSLVLTGNGRAVLGPIGTGATFTETAPLDITGGSLLVQGVAGTATFGSVTVDNSASGGTGIEVNGNSGTVSFGTTGVTLGASANSAGITFVGTNSDVSFGTTTVSGLGAAANQTAIDFSGSATTADFGLTTITGNDAATSRGIDLSSTTGGVITFLTGSSISGAGVGVELAFDHTTATSANADFTFGDGSSVVPNGRNSTIGAASGNFTVNVVGLDPASGTYNFEDVTFTGNANLPASAGSVTLVSQSGGVIAAHTAGDLSVAVDTISLANADALTGAQTFAFVGTVNIGTAPFTLDSGQTVTGFGDGHTVASGTFQPVNVQGDLGALGGSNITGNAGVMTGNAGATALLQLFGGNAVRYTAFDFTGGAGSAILIDGTAGGFDNTSGITIEGVSIRNVANGENAFGASAATGTLSILNNDIDVTGRLLDISGGSADITVSRGALPVSGTPGTLDTGGLVATDFTGTAQFTDLDVSGVSGADNAIDINQAAGTGSFTFTNLSVGGFAALATGNGIDIDATSLGAVNLTMVSGNSVSAPGDGLHVTHDAPAGGAVGLSLDGTIWATTGGAHAIDVDSQAINATYVTSFQNNTVTGGAGSGGILFNNVVFDADGNISNGADQVAGGNLNVGSALARVNGNGLELQAPTGDLAFGALNIFNDSGTGVLVDTKTAGTIFMLGSTSGTVDTTNGTALSLDPLTVDMTLTGVSSTNGANGILLDGADGTFTVNGLTSIAGTSGAGLGIQNSHGTYTFGAVTINNGASAGGGVDIDNSTSPGTTTVAFGGTLGITTGSGTGFAITGALSPASTVVTATAGGNTITTGTGTSLDWNSVAVGTGGVTFDSVSVTGAATGINLTNVGATGGAALDLGAVTIAGITSRGVDISGTLGAAVNFDSLNVGLNSSGSAVGFDLNGATVNANITAGDFDVSNASVTPGSTVGVDLSGATGSGVVQLGGNVASNQNATITGVETGVLFSGTTDLGVTGTTPGFVFGDGEGSIDANSTIDVAGFAIDGTLPGVGNYNFNDVKFGASNTSNLSSISVYYVDPLGTGDGTLADPGSIGGAEGSTANVIVLIDKVTGGTQHTIDMTTGTQVGSDGNPNSLDLKDGQAVISFASGDGTIDVSKLGVDASGGAPTSFQFTTITNSPIISAPAGINSLRPLLSTNTSAGAIVLPTSGSGTITAGVQNVLVQNSGGTGIGVTTTAASQFFLFDNDVTGTTSAVSLVAGGAFAIDQLALNIDGNSFTNAGSNPAVRILGQDLSGDNSVVVRSFANNTTQGGGVLFQDVHFDADGTSAGDQDVDAGTLTVGTTVVRVEGNGLDFLNPIGTLKFTTLNIANNNGTGLLVNTKAAGTSFTLTNIGGAIDTTNGTAVNIDPLTVNLSFASISSAGGGSGIVFDAVSGTFDVAGATTITGTSGAAISAIGDNSGGTFSFGAVTIDNTATTGGGIGWASGTLDIAGKLDIGTASGTGFAATGGTLNAANTDNAIQTATGQILNWSDTAVGADGVTFATLKSTGTVAADAISLNNVTDGTFKGGAATIAGTSGAGSDGISISGANTATLNFASATIDNTAGNGIAINTTSTTGVVTFTTVDIDGVAGNGVDITGISNADITISGGTIGATDDPTGMGVDLHNQTSSGGTVTIGAAITKTTAGKIVNIDGHAGGAILFTGNLSATGNVDNGISITNVTQGGIQFSGASKVLSTGAFTAVSLDQTSATGGAISFLNGGLQITTTTGTGFSDTSNGHGTLNITTGGFANTITTGSGTAISLSGMAIGGLGATFDSVSTGAATTGIAFTNVTGGAFVANGGSLAGTTSSAIAINGGSANFTYAGTIDDSAGFVADISNRTSAGSTITLSGNITDSTPGAGTGGGLTFSGNTAGSTTFSGASKKFDTTSGTALNVFNSAGHTITFSGTTTDIDTTSGTAINVANGGTIAFNSTTTTVNATSGFGFNAVAGGTVVVTGNAQVATQNGTVVNMNGVAVGADGVNFASTTKGAGGTEGVVLNTVTGTGTVALGGGSLVGGSGAAIRIGDGAGGANTGGTAGLTYSGSITSGSGEAIDIQDRAAGAQDITLSGNISHTVAAQTGILLADNAAGTITFSGTTKTIGSTTTATAVSIANTGAAVVFSNGGLNIDTSSGTGLNVSGSGSVTISGGSNTIDTTTGTAFANTSGSATVTSDAALTTTGAGRVVDIQSRTANAVTLSGNIINSGAGALGINVQNLSGGSVTFSGGTKTLSTGANTAVNLTGNTVATVNFSNGGLAITTTSGTGFNATGGGTVTVQGSGNTINSTSGTALNVANTTIGASGLTFQSVSSGSGANSTATGIILDTTGTLGGLTVTGTGSAGSGGTIQHKTGSDLSRVTGTGIYLNNTANVSLSWMQLNDFQNFGIRGFGVSGFTLAHSVINGVNGTNTANNGADDAGEGSVYFGSSSVNGLTGTVNITNDTISGGAARNFSSDTTSGTLHLAIANVAFGLNQNLSGSSQSLLVEARNAGTTVNTTLTNSTFAGAPSDNVNFTGQTGTIMNVTMTGNTLSNTHAGNIIGGGGMTLATQGQMIFNVSNNTITGANGSAVTLFKASAGTDLEGTFSNNAIGTNGVAGSGSATGNGIFLSAAGAGTITLNIANNVIQGIGGNAGIYMDNTGGSYTVNATITGNVIREPGPGVFAGLALTAGGPSTLSDSVQVFANIQNNDFGSADPNNAGDIFMYVATSASNITLTGANPGDLTSASTIAAFLQSRNNLNGAAATTDVTIDLSQGTGTIANWHGSSSVPPLPLTPSP